MTEDDIIDAILAREGGDRYTDLPADMGGPTKFGVTRATLSQWRGKPCWAEDVAGLTELEARAIYRNLFIVRPRFDQITDPRLRVLVIDTGVNSGPTAAVSMLQRALGVADDGIFGPKTWAALAAAPAGRTFACMCAERVRFYGRLVTRRPGQAVFASGWANRVAEFIEQLG